MNSSEPPRNNSSRRRMLGGRASGSLIPACPQVAEAAHRADMHARRLDLCAQARHVDFDRVGREWIVQTEQASADLLLAEHAPGPGEEKLEQRPFARRE